MSQAENENRQRHRRHGQISHAAGEEKAKPVPEIIDRFEQKLADVAVLDVRGDLPVVFIHGGQRVHDGDEQIIGNHLGDRCRRRPCAAWLRIAG